MIDKTRVPRESLTLSNFFSITLSNLASVYLAFNPTKTRNDFDEEIFFPLSSYSNLRGDTVLQQITDAQRGGLEIDFRYGPILISCAYCIQAKKEIEKNDRELAWSYMADARYWCGVVSASKGVELARTQTIQATRKNTAAKGGIARAERHKEIKPEAWRLAREKSPKEKGWQSRRQAVQAIAKDVFEFSKSKGVSFSETQFEQTMDNWLKKMPDAASLFPKKKQGKKSPSIPAEQNN